MIKKILIFLLFLFPSILSSSPLTGTMNSDYNVPYLYDSKSGYSNPDWMKHIAGNKLISELSIPGTNHSLSRQGGEYFQTQTLSIYNQLLMGIRFFDVRFKFRDGDLYAFNGAENLNTTFEEFLHNVSEFLSVYSTEVVIIRIVNEAGISDSEVDFYRKFIETRDQFKQFNHIPQGNNFYLSDARGKFVFIRDFKVKRKIGIDRYPLFVQQDDKLNNNLDLYTKWQSVKKHMIEFDELEESVISLNYLSGSVGVFPYFIASGKENKMTFSPQLSTGFVTSDMNKWTDFPRVNCDQKNCEIQFLGINALLTDWINKQRFITKLGIIVADFPGARLVQTIIESNIELLKSSENSSDSLREEGKIATPRSEREF